MSNRLKKLFYICDSIFWGGGSVKFTALYEIYMFLDLSNFDSLTFMLHLPTSHLFKLRYNLYFYLGTYHFTPFDALYVLICVSVFSMPLKLKEGVLGLHKI